MRTVPNPTPSSRVCLRDITEHWLCALIILGVLGFILACLKYLPHQDLERVGPFLQGIGVVSTGLGAWFIVAVVTEKRRREELWIAERNRQAELYSSAERDFRDLYERYWHTEKISRVRRWIVSRTEYYEILQPILKKRNEDELNDLMADENQKLDTLDQFIAVLVRIKSLSVSWEYKAVSEDQRKLWTKMLSEKFWVNYAYVHRPELWTYLYNYWGVLLPKDAPEIPVPNTKLNWEDKDDTDVGSLIYHEWIHVAFSANTRAQLASESAESPPGLR